MLLQTQCVTIVKRVFVLEITIALEVQTLFLRLQLIVILLPLNILESGWYRVFRLTQSVSDKLHEFFDYFGVRK